MTGKRRKLDLDICTSNSESRLQCVWTIRNFCSLPLNARIHGPVHYDHRRNWKLTVDPIEIAKTSYGFLNIYLYLDSEESIYFWFEISVLDEHKRVHKSKTSFAYYSGDANFWGFEKFIEGEELFTNMQHLICDCALTVNCKIRVFNELVAPKDEFRQNVASLLTDESLSDVTFRVKEKHFRAHKVILGVRSDVFKAMFTSQFLETSSNEVIIDDIEDDVFQELLRYIYTDSVSNINDVAKGLLMAAEKYNLPPLKSMCQFALLNELQADNALEYLLLADSNRAIVLKQFAVDLIINHFCEIQMSEEWNRFRKCDKDGGLVEEIMKSMALKCAAFRKGFSCSDLLWIQ